MGGTLDEPHAKAAILVSGICGVRQSSTADGQMESNHGSFELLVSGQLNAKIPVGRPEHFVTRLGNTSIHLLRPTLVSASHTMCGAFTHGPASSRHWRDPGSCLHNQGLIAQSNFVNKPAIGPCSCDGNTRDPTGDRVQQSTAAVPPSLFVHILFFFFFSRFFDRAEQCQPLFVKVVLGTRLFIHFIHLTRY